MAPVGSRDGQGAFAQQSAQIAAIEMILRQRLAVPGASPFISHIGLDHKYEGRLQEVAKIFVGGRAYLIARFLERHPACGLWLLVKPISDEYGAEDGYGIYPIIARTFGVLGEIPTTNRSELNKAFRAGCRKLNLAVAGFRPTGFVDDYIFQAGVARTQVSHLVEAFLRAELLLGPAPDDDTQRLNAWEDQAAEFIPWTNPRIRNILRQDETGFHAQCFARVRRGEQCANELERLIAEEVERKAGTLTIRKIAGLAPPLLTFRDDALQLLAPPTDTIIAEIGGRERTIKAGGRLTLPMPWPDHIRWRRSDPESGKSSQPPISVLGGDQQVLAFDVDTGRLLRAITSAASTRPEPVDAGEVAFLARSEFTISGERSINLGREAYGLIAQLRGKAVIEIEDKHLAVIPPARPLIELDLPRVGTGEAGPLCGIPQSARVSFPTGRPEGQLVFVAEHPALDTPLRLPLGDNDGADISLEGPFSKPGPAGPLRLAVVLSGSERALVRVSAWVWPGLDGLIDGVVFNSPDIPRNLLIGQSRYVARGGDGRLALVMDEQYRFARVAFDLGDHKTVWFDVPRPGVTVSLASDDGAERFVPAGTTLAANRESSDSLVIRNTDHDASLDVRGQIEPHAFGRSGVRRISVAALVGSAVHDEIRLVQPAHPESNRMLVRIAPTTAPLDFALERERRDGSLTAKFSSQQAIDAIKIVATDHMTGRVVEAATALSRWPVNIPDLGLIKGWAALGKVAVSVKPQVLGDGLWTGELLVRQESTERWMPLINARGDRYPLGLASGHQYSQSETLAESRLAFLRLTDALNVCAAEECWPMYRDVVETSWQNIGTALANTAAGRMALMEAIARPMPLDASPTWVPVRHPIELEPALFSADALLFRSIHDSEMEGASEFASISRCVGLETVKDALEKVPIDVYFFQGYENFLKAARNDKVRLSNFDFARYQDALKDVEEQRGTFWRSRDGRLSAAHHAWCIDRFIERVERVTPVGVTNNIQRIPQATHAALAAQKLAHGMYLHTDERTIERLSLAGMVPALFSSSANAFRNGRTGEYWQALAATAERSVPEVLRDYGFLSRLAPELLGFYLLLWELERLSRTL